jgi:hypothetical protein
MWKIIDQAYFFGNCYTRCRCTNGLKKLEFEILNNLNNVKIRR